MRAEPEILLPTRSGGKRLQAQTDRKPRSASEASAKTASGHTQKRKIEFVFATDKLLSQLPRNFGVEINPKTKKT